LYIASKKYTLTGNEKDNIYWFAGWVNSINRWIDYGATFSNVRSFP